MNVELLLFVLNLLILNKSVQSSKSRCRNLTIPERVNKAQSSWKANEDVDFSREYKIYKDYTRNTTKYPKWLIKNCKTYLDPDVIDASAKRMMELDSKLDPNVTEIPESFNPIDNWPACGKSFDHIYDQGSCGNCWAVASASVMTDRTCIANSSFQQLLSSDDIVGCVREMGYSESGCASGRSHDAFQFWKQFGVVTGGDFQDNTTCKPTSFDPDCDATPCSLKVYIDSHEKLESESKYECKEKCTNKNHPISYLDDKHKATSAKEIYHIGFGALGFFVGVVDKVVQGVRYEKYITNEEKTELEECLPPAKAKWDEYKPIIEKWKNYNISTKAKIIQLEIMDRGPVTVSARFSPDFLHYKSGVYSHVTGDAYYGHQIKIVGWGITDGIKHWNVRNGWGTDWGDKGSVKVKIIDQNPSRNDLVFKYAITGQA